MEVAKFQYKCRRCGKIELNPCTAEKNAHLLLLCAVYGYDPPQSFIPAPQMFSIHLCNDKGLGVADLIGYSIFEE